MSSTVGEIKQFINAASKPSNFTIMDGALLSIAVNQDLYNLIGFDYTTGQVPNGYFNAPDATGKTLVSYPLNIGSTGGSDQVAIQVANLPSTSIAVSGAVKLNVNEEDPNKTEGAGMTLGNTQGSTGNNYLLYNNQAPDTSSASIAGISHDLSVSLGSGNLLDVRSKYLAVLTCICHSV